MSSETVVETALAQVGIAQEDIRLEATLREDLAIDSTEMVEIAVKIKKLAGLEISERDLKGIRTVSDLVQLVEAQMVAANQ